MITNEIVNKLRQLEESLWIAETRFDQAYMDELCANDFFEFGRSGRIYDRKTIIHVAPQPIDAKLPLQNFKVNSLSKHLFLLTYRSEVTYKGVVELGNRSSIWSNEQGKWILHFHQGTPTQ